MIIDYFGTGNNAGDYSFLSNFYEFNGTTVEHWFQAAKTATPEWAAKILDAPTPGMAKKLGRQASLRPTWDYVKLDYMRAFLMVKFSDPVLAQKLLDTGDAILIEGNTWGDTFWGEVRGQGYNWLGVLLMQIRNILRERHIHAGAEPDGQRGQDIQSTLFDKG